MLRKIIEKYRDYTDCYVGTGAGTKNVGFYESVGFEKSHVVENFFVESYDFPIIEDGVQLFDMQYLKINMNK